MTLPIRHSLGLLAGELGVDISDLDDDQLAAVAIRFILEDTVTADVLQRLVDDARRGEPGPTAAPAGSTAQPRLPRSKTPFRFNSTEATEAKYRARLARAHQTEDRRTALYLVPRSPDRIHPSEIHQACLVAARDHGTPCERCSWLLEDDPYTDAHLDDADDTGVR